MWFQCVAGMVNTDGITVIPQVLIKDERTASSTTAQLLPMGQCFCKGFLELCFRLYIYITGKKELSFQKWDYKRKQRQLHCEVYWLILYRFVFCFKKPPTLFSFRGWKIWIYLKIHITLWCSHFGHFYYLVPFQTSNHHLSFHEKASWSIRIVYWSISRYNAWTILSKFSMCDVPNATPQGLRELSGSG